MTWRGRQKLLGIAIKGAFVAYWVLAASFLAGPAIRLVAAPGDITATSLFNLAFAATAWGLGFFGFFYSVLALYIWRDTKQIWSAVSRRQRQAMWQLQRIAKSTNSSANRLQRQMIFYLIYLVFGTAALALTADFRWMGLAFYAGGALVWARVRFSALPFILYLSTSDPHSGKFHGQLRELVRPLRAISLLDIEADSTADKRASPVFDCLRTEVDDDWWHAIKALMEMAAVIVFNADTNSAGVTREVRYAFERDFKYKTVFLTGGGSRLLRTEAEIAGQIPGCLVARTPILEGIVAEILDQRKPPSRDQTVWDFARAARSKTGGWSRPSTGSLGATFTRKTSLGIFSLNPYLAIMMMCPLTQRPVSTGFNSSYFEDWSGYPPKDAARFRCDACGQEHSFDNTDTWLERPSRHP